MLSSEQVVSSRPDVLSRATTLSSKSGKWNLDVVTTLTPPKRDAVMLPAYGPLLIPFTEDSGPWFVIPRSLLRGNLCSSVVRSTLSLTMLHDRPHENPERWSAFGDGLDAEKHYSRI